MLTKDEAHIVHLAEKAYIKILGKKKWNSLTDQQKHDAIMIMVNDMLLRVNMVLIG